MGIESRDYLRGETGPRSFGGGTDVVTKLIIANVVIFVLQLVTRQSGIVESWLALGPDDVTSRFQIWRLLTYAFCHDPDSIWHILFNMYWVRNLAVPTAHFYGAGRVVVIYVVSGVTGFVASTLAFFLPLPIFLRGSYLSIGASASILGLLGALVGLTLALEVYA